eukprot:5955340-Prymnesium_polylepis.1
MSTPGFSMLRCGCIRRKLNGCFKVLKEPLDERHCNFCSQARSATEVSASATQKRVLPTNSFTWRRAFTWRNAAWVTVEKNPLYPMVKKPPTLHITQRQDRHTSHPAPKGPHCAQLARKGSRRSCPGRSRRTAAACPLPSPS